MSNKTIFIGVAWPYANGPLHLGHLSGCYLPADIFARYNRLAGNRVLMVSGSDQHGTPITVRARNEGVSPREVAGRYHQLFLDTWNRLGIQWDLFTSTTTDNHRDIVQKTFLTLLSKGYIYKAAQQMLYCTKDSQFLPDRYVEGTCPYCRAPNARGDQCDDCQRTLSVLDLKSPRCKLCGLEPETRDTEHFFFRWSAFTEPLKEWSKDKTFWRSNVINFTRRYLEEGLKDSAITRDIDWGIPVPVEGFENKSIYVWFEAVIGYLSASIEWSHNNGNPEQWEKWWKNPDSESYYFIGKDNIPFHTLRWPAVLLGLTGLNLPYNVPANEYLTLEGRAFSTSRNWALWAHEVLERYEPDTIRYVLTALMPERSDSNFSWHEFFRRNNNELVAVWGNLVHRALTFTHNHFEGKVPPLILTPDDEKLLNSVSDAFTTVGSLITECQFREALGTVMELCREANRYLDYQKPWAVVKTDRERSGTIVATVLQFIASARVLFAPFLPHTSSRLHSILGYEGPLEAETWAPQDLPAGQALKSVQVLFKKLDENIVEEEKKKLIGAEGCTVES